MTTPRTLDELRAAYPHLGLALYAYEPGKGVMLECIDPSGKSFTFTDKTEAAVIAAAFADDEETTEPERPAITHTDPPRSGAAPRKDAVPAAPTPTSVFD